MQSPWLAFVLVSALGMAGCASNITFVKRGSSLVGTGTAEGFGQTLSAVIGDKTCSGEYTTVSQGGGFGLVNAFGSRGGSMTGTTAWIPTGGVAAGILRCSNGDVLRCELQFSGTRGFGVCRDNNNDLYDVIAK